MSTPRFYYNEFLIDDRIAVVNGTVDMTVYPYKMYELLQVLQQFHMDGNSSGELEILIVQKDIHTQLV